MSFDSKAFLIHTSVLPGVYRMYDTEGALLYVGKAKNLKNRLSSYFTSALNNKTQALVARINSIEVSITSSETEALILEHNLIKENKPPYNILLKDDKSYPYIFLSDHAFPLLTQIRGKKNKAGRYFGPYPNASSVKESISFLQRVFRLRNCEDSYFSNRSRPCMQHQIGRCSAPCVGLIDQDAYRADIQSAGLFLLGKNQDLIVNLQDKMMQCSVDLKFEQAAFIRDQIKHLRKAQESQFIDASNGNIDILGVAQEGSVCAIHVANIRHGKMLGSRSYYPKFTLGEDESQALAFFIGQFYLVMNREVPDEIVVSHAIEDKVLLQDALSESRGKRIKVSHSVRNERLRWQQMALLNAQESVRLKLKDRSQLKLQYKSLEELLSLSSIKRMECFDISHSHGEATVASCVVFNTEGALKADYRKFNIEGEIAGDDYGSMRQALHRRFTKLAEDKVPDLLLVDGGKGQLNIALEVLAGLELAERIPVLGVSKGTTRKAGMEILLFNDREFTLGLSSPALHLIQQIRDESHRFAITGHRARRAKSRNGSLLEGISGIGPKRRKELLKFFGDASQVKSASAVEIAKVPGISKRLAQEIYDSLHV